MEIGSWSSMWNAGDANCRTPFIGSNHHVGVRCRRSEGQALSMLRS